MPISGSNKLFIVMYHYTRDLVHSRYPHIKGLDLPLFREQLEFFASHFNVVSMEDVLASLHSTERINTKALPENALLLTFDDGYIDNYTFAMPLLEQFGFQGSFFIPGKTFTEHRLLDVNKIHYILASAEDIDGGIKRLVSDLFSRMDFYRGHEFDFPSNEELYKDWAVPNRFDSGDVVFIKRILQTVLPEQLRNRISSDLFETYVGVSETQLAYELYMTEDQIKTIKRRGHFIGLHGYDHYWLGRLTPEQMRADIDKALSVMNGLGVIEPDKWVMNYPYGNYSQEVIDYVVKCGCVCGVTTEVRVAEIGKDESMKLPRLDCNDFPPKSGNYKKLWAQTKDAGI